MLTRLLHAAAYPEPYRARIVRSIARRLRIGSYAARLEIEAAGRQSADQVDLAEREKSQPVPHTQRSILFRAILILALLNGLGFIWWNRFIPMSDYPDWLYQGWIFSRVLRGAPLLHYALKHHPVPYATLVTIAMGSLDLITAPETAGKIVLSLVLCLFTLGSASMLRSLRISERNPLLLIPVLLTLNSYFFNGELSFLCGIGFFFLYCGFLFRRLDDLDSISIPTFTGWSLLLFFSHLLPYLCAILVTGCVAITGINRRRMWCLSIAIFPTAAATVWYTGARIVAHNLGSGPLWIWWTPHLIAGRFLAAFSPYPEFLPSYGIHAPGMPLAAILNLLVFGLIAVIWIACAAVWLEGRRTRAAILFAAAIHLAASVLTGYAFAGMVSPGERFLYPAAWLAMTWLILHWPIHEYVNLGRAATVVLAGLIVLQGGFIDSYGGEASQELARAYEQLAAAGSRADFCNIYEHYVRLEQVQPHRKGLNRFLTAPSAFLRLPYYLYIEREEPAPIFRIGIFDYDGPGNNENLCS